MGSELIELKTMRIK